MMGERVFADKAKADGSFVPDLGAKRRCSCCLVLLSAWCGLVAGLLEVGVIVLRKRPST